ncbi:unnamed protein product [Prunus armeniaca]
MPIDRCSLIDVLTPLKPSTLAVVTFPILQSSPLIGDLGDYMTTIGKARDDARIQAKLPKIENKQVPNQEVPSQSETWGTPLLVTNFGIRGSTAGTTPVLKTSPAVSVFSSDPREEGPSGPRLSTYLYMRTLQV